MSRVSWSPGGEHSWPQGTSYYPVKCKNMTPLFLGTKNKESPRARGVSEDPYVKGLRLGGGVKGRVWGRNGRVVTPMVRGWICGRRRKTEDGCISPLLSIVQGGLPYCGLLTLAPPSSTLPVYPSPRCVLSETHTWQSSLTIVPAPCPSILGEKTEF